MNISDRVIWPDEEEQYGWPPDLPREESLNAFRSFFAKVGYADCPDAQPEAGFEKIVIYMRDGKVTHAARLQTNGRWTSKLGQGIDCDHLVPDVLANGPYGVPIQYMRRPLGGQVQLPELHPPPAQPPLLIIPPGAL